MTFNRLLSLSALIGLIFSASSCIPLAVGAAAGYVAHDNGYRVQAPLKKEESSESRDVAPPSY